MDQILIQEVVHDNRLCNWLLSSSGDKERQRDKEKKQERGEVSDWIPNTKLIEKAITERRQSDERICI